MNKQSKQLLILLIVLVLLVAGFFGLKQYNKVQSEKGEEDTKITVVDVNKDDIVKLSYVYEGQTYTFEKQDGTWYYADDHSLNVTQYKIGNMATMVAPLKAQQVLENVTDMTQYGLAQPERTIQFETADASYIFEVGDYNSVAGVRYICEPSGTTVYAVDSGVISIFDKSLDDVVETTEETTDEATEDVTEESTGESTEEVTDGAVDSDTTVSDAATEDTSEAGTDADVAE